MMPPWPGSWFEPMPAPWCAHGRGAGVPWCVVGWNDVSGLYIHVAIRWAAVQFVLHVRRHGVANAYNLGIVGGQLVVIHAS